MTNLLKLLKNMFFIKKHVFLIFGSKKMSKFMTANQKDMFFNKLQCILTLKTLFLIFGSKKMSKNMLGVKK